jgi:hypothetical protein
MSIADTGNSPQTQPVAWLVSHAYSNHILHEGLIGNRLKEEPLNSFEPKTRIFKDIKQGDIIAYFDYKAGCLLGLFTVCEKEASAGMFENTVKKGENWFLLEDNNWDPALVHHIKPYCKFEDKWIDLRRYIKDHENESGFSKELLKYLSKVEKVKGSKAEAKLQEQVCIKLNPTDNQILKKLLEETLKSRYWVETPNVLFSNSEEVSSLLDFYNNRATSFANLFVASIFGIVTLSAIVVSVIDGNFGRAIFSMLPFWFFVIAGAYTYYRYSFYAGIAEEIKGQGFCYCNVQTFKSNSTTDKHLRNMGLTGFIEREKHSKTASLKKRVAKIPFTLIYVLAIVTLFVFVYWNLFFP